MSSTYKGVASNITGGTGVEITVPSDGDAATAASVNDPGPFEPSADFAESLYESLVAKHALDVWDNGAVNSIVTPAAVEFIPFLGLWVMCGDGGKISTSPDGVTWTSRTTGVSIDLKAIAHNVGIVVVVGNCIDSSHGPTILTSPDGITWTSRTSGGSNNTNLSSVIFDPGFGIFLAVGDEGKIISSSDGTTYSASAQISGAYNLWTIATNGQGMVMVGGQYTNGMTLSPAVWTCTSAPTVNTSYIHQDLTSEGMVGRIQQVAYSPPCECWMVIDSGGSPYPNSLLSTSGAGTSWNASQYTTAADAGFGTGSPANRLRWNGRAFVFACNPWAVEYFIPQANVWRADVPVAMVNSGYTPTCIGVSDGSFHCIYGATTGSAAKVFNTLAWRYL